jgi:SAM-dependent methyltransferase
MLALARDLNPEAEYFQGDMRTIRLDRKFDTVVIPDSIMYMTTLEDLERAIRTAVLHLVPGGFLLVVAHPKESFRDNNFVYQGSDGDIRVTLFENNHVISENSYEAALVYLIRRNGELRIHHDIHKLGLFSNGEWLEVFEDSGLDLEEAADMDDLYDDYLMDEGEYRLKVYLCRKRGERP